uniref:Rab proteins geranylgeranyltransferase component A n=1 Tax=Panstrongylus megistus TaxID=65343 RepID=A0A069DVP2_9HEMI
MDDDLPTEYDVIVVGTGLVESIVAAAASRIGKKVLHIDGNSYYGQQWATFSLDYFEQWLDKINNNSKGVASKDVDNELLQYERQYYVTNKDELSISNAKWKWYLLNEVENSCQGETASVDSETTKKDEGDVWTRDAIKKLTQKFNIDLSPKILFSKGPMVELLIRSGVSRYTEFVSVHNVLLYLNSVIESVPYSKSDVFSTRTVSVVEKRILMKLLQEIQNFNHDSLEDEQNKNETFSEFLKKFQIPDNIEKYILYSIARVSKESPCSEGIKAAQIFLNSLGIYSNSPFLWPLYGSSELVQAFCRLCAVYGGIYCLNRGAEKIIVETNKCIGILSGSKELFAEHIVMSSSQTPMEFYLANNSTEIISRGILITDKTLYSSGKRGASMLQFPSEDSTLPPITIIELDNSALACPAGLCLVHLIKKGPDDGFKEFDKVLKELFEPCEIQKPMLKNHEELAVEPRKPCVLFKLYFNISQISSEPSEMKPTNFYTCTGPVQFELDFFSALVEAEKMFRQMFPDEEFLPTPVETTSEE